MNPQLLLSSSSPAPVVGTLFSSGAGTLVREWMLAVLVIQADFVDRLLMTVKNTAGECDLLVTAPAFSLYHHREAAVCLVHMTEHTAAYDDTGAVQIILIHLAVKPGFNTPTSFSGSTQYNVFMVGAV